MGFGRNYREIWPFLGGWTPKRCQRPTKVSVSSSCQAVIAPGFTMPRGPCRPTTRLVVVLDDGRPDPLGRVGEPGGLVDVPTELQLVLEGRSVLGATGAVGKSAPVLQIVDFGFAKHGAAPDQRACSAAPWPGPAPTAQPDASDAQAADCESPEPRLRDYAASQVSCHAASLKSAGRTPCP